MASSDERTAHGQTVLRALLIGGLVLLCAILVYLVSNLTQSVHAGNLSDQVLNDLVEQIPEPYHDATANPDKEGEALPMKQVGGYYFLGTITIPSVEIDLPVAVICDDEHLQVSPCRWDGSYYTDDFIICGEGYASHFGPLGNVGIRDEVRFLAADGGIHRYIVSNVETDEVDEIDKILDDWDLTLFTFNVDGTARVVRCVRA